MPIENEIKYVLDCNGRERQYVHLLMNLPGSQSYSFRQGYVDAHCRIRSIEQNGTKEFLFTFKQKINGVVTEIETPISEDDFNRLWTRVGQVLTKIRIVVPHGVHLWEVDFFYHMNNQKKEYYLVMAEVELPESDTAPDNIPEFITDKLLYVVPLTDNRFASKFLTKPNAVRKLVEGVKNV